MSPASPQPSWVQPGVLKSPVPTAAPYPVRSSLPLEENFIFFLLGSAELLLARIVEEKDISDRQWPRAALGLQDVTLRTVQEHVRGVGLVRRGEAGDAGSGPACTTDYRCSPEEVTLSLQASASPAVEQGWAHTPSIVSYSFGEC